MNEAHRIFHAPSQSVPIPHAFAYIPRNGANGRAFNLCSLMPFPQSSQIPYVPSSSFFSAWSIFSNVPFLRSTNVRPVSSARSLRALSPSSSTVSISLLYSLPSCLKSLSLTSFHISSFFSVSIFLSASCFLFDIIGQLPPYKGVQGSVSILSIPDIFPVTTPCKTHLFLIVPCQLSL